MNSCVMSVLLMIAAVMTASSAVASAQEKPAFRVTAQEVSTKDAPDVADPVIARVNGTTIYLDEFMRRATYTFRPPYCQGNGGFDKKVVLNSLIAEKMLALDAAKDDSVLVNDIHFKRMMDGRKEQLMRDLLFEVEGRDKVKLDSTDLAREFNLAGRTYHIQYFSAPDDSAAGTVQSILDTSESEFAVVYRTITGSDSIPEREVSWNEGAGSMIHHALFDSPLRKGQVVGPIEASDNQYLFMKIIGWTDEHAVTFSQVETRMSEVRGELTEEKAAELYESFVLRAMNGKKLELIPSTFDKFVRISAPYYLRSETAEKSSYLAGAYHGTHANGDHDTSMSLKDLTGALKQIDPDTLFVIDGRAWTVSGFARELEIHPLVFEHKGFDWRRYPEELRLAIAGLVRDRYMTEIAYARGYDEDPAVVHGTQIWRDAEQSLWQEYYYLNSQNFSGDDPYQIARAMNPYVDSLRHEYGNAVEINVDAFNQIRLTSAQSFATERNVPFPLLVPSFPVVTTHKWLDYGRKMNSSDRMQDTPTKAAEPSVIVP